MTLTRSIKLGLRHLGIDVHRYRPDSSVEAQLTLILFHLAPDLIIDVGANVGQYAQMLRRCKYRGRIVSFEPLAGPHAALTRTAQRDPSWEVGPRLALGHMGTELTMHVSANSVSSSLLPILPTHLNAAPESRYVGTERVAVKRLDEVIGPYLKNANRILLKVDTQGYEDKVVSGASLCLDRVIALHLELSFVALYAGQALFIEMVEDLGQKGFGLFALTGGQVDPVSGRTLQTDVVFARGV